MPIVFSPVKREIHRDVLREQNWYGDVNRLADGSGHLEVLADEHVVRPTDLNHVDGVRAVAQFQYTIDGAAGVLDERGGLGFVCCLSRDDRSGAGTPVLRTLTFDSLVRARLRQPLCEKHARDETKVDDRERNDRERDGRFPGRNRSGELSEKHYE